MEGTRTFETEGTALGKDPAMIFYCYSWIAIHVEIHSIDLLAIQTNRIPSDFWYYRELP